MPPTKNNDELDSLLKIADNVFAAGKLLANCQKTKCNAAVLDAQKQGELVRRRALSLVQQLKERKITPKEKEHRRISDSKASLAVMECAVRQCHAEARSVMGGFASAHAHACKFEKNDKACVAHAHLKKIIAKRAPMTVSDFKTAATGGRILRGTTSPPRRRME